MIWAINYKDSNRNRYLNSPRLVNKQLYRHGDESLTSLWKITKEILLVVEFQKTITVTSALDL